MILDEGKDVVEDKAFKDRTKVVEQGDGTMGEGISILSMADVCLYRVRQHNFLF